MKVFVSSVIKDFNEFRDAAAAAVTSLGYAVVRAEDFGASPATPQRACLAGVREADAVVLILGSRYGAVQASGLSATHEEYGAARDEGPVLVFLEEGIEPEPQQAEFIAEVQSWEDGHFTARFRNANELRDVVTRSLHGYVVVSEKARPDEDEIVARALALVPESRWSGSPDIVFTIAGGPMRSVLRPAELDDDELKRFLLTSALTSVDAVLTPSSGTDVQVEGDTIRLVQSQGHGLVSVSETGDIVVIQPAIKPQSGIHGIQSIIEELVIEKLINALRFGAATLDRIDPTHRISHVGPVAHLRGGGHMPWRTRSEQQQSPNSAVMSSVGTQSIPVVLSPAVRRRAALSQDAARLAEDFTVRLRRQVRP